jgi:kynureninase
MDQYSLEYSRNLDFLDPLKDFRQKFLIPSDNLVYLDGNSLGMLPAETPLRMGEVINDEWGRGLIGSWNTGWYERSKKISAKIAPIIGAQPDEVIVTDSTSVNLFKLAYAALQLQQGKNGIVSDELNFPSDIYLLQGLVDIFRNQHDLRLARSHDGLSVSTEELDEKIGNDTALLSLSHVVFKSAFMYDMKAVTALAHKKGAMVLWDLSHAVGAVPVDLNGSDADLAVGCTYKYLNGGPGSPAFLYVRKDLQTKLKSPIWGWFGQHNPFDFKLDYQPAQGIERFLAGTPPMLSLSALTPALDMIMLAGIDRIRNKSIQQSNYLIKLYRKLLQPLGFQLGSPENENERGSHISFCHPEAFRICKALIEPRDGEPLVIPDFREPDNIRIGITPLYTRFEDLFICANRLLTIVENKSYEKFSSKREKVT